MIFPDIIAVENIKYNGLLILYRQKIKKELLKIVKAEAMGNKPDTIKLNQIWFAINYIFALYTMSLDSNDLDYWKERMEYEEIKNCFLLKDIDLDELLNLLV